MSFMKNKNSIVDNGSPCFKPIVTSRKSEHLFSFVNRMHDFTLLYIDLSKFTILQLTPNFTSLPHKMCLFI